MDGRADADRFPSFMRPDADGNLNINFSGGSNCEADQVE